MAPHFQRAKRRMDWPEVVVVLVGTFLIQYLREKGKNFATREDVRNITERIESVKSQYASQLHISQVRYEKEFEILSDLADQNMIADKFAKRFGPK